MNLFTSKRGNRILDFTIKKACYRCSATQSRAGLPSHALVVGANPYDGQPYENLYDNNQLFVSIKASTRNSWISSHEVDLNRFMLL